jgi:hypothetical protein
MIDLDGTAVIVVVSTLLGSKGNQRCMNSMVMFMPCRSFSCQWSPWNSSSEGFERARCPGHRTPHFACDHVEPLRDEAGRRMVACATLKVGCAGRAGRESIIEASSIPSRCRDRDAPHLRIG